MTDATFFALMQLLDDLLNVLTWAIGTAGIAAGISALLILALRAAGSWFVSKDEEVLGPSNAAQLQAEREQADKDMESIHAACRRRVRAGGM